MLTCNNSSGLPCDRVQHFWCDLGGLQSVSPLPSARAKQTNHILSRIASCTSSSLSEKKCMLWDKLSMEPSRLHGCNDNKGIKPVNKRRHSSATWGPVVGNQGEFQFLRGFFAGKWGNHSWDATREAGYENPGCLWEAQLWKRIPSMSCSV